jgi:glycosyltransferase involved in cell wall biosynthesis
MDIANAPRVSILLPVRDAAATLAACLRSVRRQTESRWECVLVDDGSVDGSRELLRRAARDDPRFRLSPRPRAGLVAALNAGLALCRGRYVARMDADDLMHRSRLEEQAAMLDARPELGAVGCHVRRFPRRGLTDGGRAYERWLNQIGDAAAVRREAFVECPVAHPTLMARRALLLEAGYRDRGWPEDYDLLLRWLAGGVQVGMLPRRRLAWRDDPASHSRTSPAYSLASFTRCKAAFLAASFLAGSACYDLWGYGGTGRALRRALAEHGKRPRRIVELHPGRLGQRIHGAPVIRPEQLGGAAPRAPLIVSVAGAGPRREIRAALAALGYREAEHYYCAA